jgi:uncharacterized membrane protein YkgB
MQRFDAVGKLGLAILRYGLVLLLVTWGGAKFGPQEAAAIQPLVSHSPFLSWLYPLFGLQGTSAIFGVVEVAAGILIATRHWLPRVSGVASLIASGTFVTTLSFLITTPDVFAPSSPWGGFLMKDIILLGAALFTASEAFGASQTKEIALYQTTRRSIAA